MLHRESRWQRASTLLLVFAVAAMTLGLGAVAAETAVDAVAGPTLPPWDDTDPRAYLAHMTALQHRQGLPLPGDVGRLQSLFVAATPPSRPWFSRRCCSSRFAHRANE